mmetsp:Transcript_6472/g.18537  ORF Transcript_6472/g.18537 Transcript_6472/m.18537 type:complete len:329 (+) Transcript_6472:145-1131(+)
MSRRNTGKVSRKQALACLSLVCFYHRCCSPSIQLLLPGAHSFSPPGVGIDNIETKSLRRDLGATRVRGAEGDDDKGPSSLLSNYNDSDGASKGIVGSLTGIVNRVSATRAKDETTPPSPLVSSPPTSSQELMDRIRKDYEERNYLWTGDLDLECFRKDCVFTDPTISFVGTDKFTENTQNLVPIVEAFAEDYRSELLSISLGTGSSSSSQTPDTVERDGRDGDGDEYYVETRWNMVGSLTASPWLFWKPKIDVVGRTKFWFRNESDGDCDGSIDSKSGSDPSDGNALKVYFYDESWEVPAWKALLQIITPAGTFPSTTSNGIASDTKP